MAVSANRLELLQIADAVAREKVDRQADRARRHGGRDPEGGALALRRRRPTSAPRSTRKTGETAPVAPCCWWSTTRSRTTPREIAARRRRASATRPPRSATVIAETAAADRFRPHRRPVGQAGHRPEGARGRARPPVRRIQGPHRRDRQRHRQARRIRQRHRRSRPRRGDRPPRRADPARDLPLRRPHPRLSSTTCAASSAARRSSCRAPIRSSWPSCSPRKCRKSMTASSRSSRSPAIPARAPRSP